MPFTFRFERDEDGESTDKKVRDAIKQPMRGLAKALKALGETLVRIEAEFDFE